MREARVAAQAKVNLRLRILEREPSGFHQLETLFQRIELADRVRVCVDVTGKHLGCDGPAVPREGLGDVRDNLAWRAAEAYADACDGWPDGFIIEIEKHVPVGGGLGGGSADAAAVLRALEALSPRPLGAALLEVAARLGSDVPFLATEHAFAIGRGRGERLQPLPALPSRLVLLLVPPFGVNTGEAYRWLAESRSGHGVARSVEPPLDRAAIESWADVEHVASNDFEPVVGARHPEILQALGLLRSRGAAPAMMSGSGSTVFGCWAPGAFPGLAPPDGFQLLRTFTATGAAPVELRDC